MATTVTPIQISLREAREKAGLTQTELAEKAGVAQRVISEMETGRTKEVRLETFERLCRALGKEPWELVFIDVRPPKRRR